jgi:hypothetical protein
LIRDSITPTPMKKEKISQIVIVAADLILQVIGQLQRLHFAVNVLRESSDTANEIEDPGLGCTAKLLGLGRANLVQQPRSDTARTTRQQLTDGYEPLTSILPRNLSRDVTWLAIMRLTAPNRNASRPSAVVTKRKRA